MCLTSLFSTTICFASLFTTLSQFHQDEFFPKINCFAKINCFTKINFLVFSIYFKHLMLTDYKFQKQILKYY